MTGSTCKEGTKEEKGKRHTKELLRSYKDAQVGIIKKKTGKETQENKRKSKNHVSILLLCHQTGLDGNGEQHKATWKSSLTTSLTCSH